MLVTVVVMFGLCWLPIHAFTLVMDYNPQLLEYNTVDDYKFFMGLYLAAHWLAMSNSFANPIIYGFTNEMFRVRITNIKKIKLSKLINVKHILFCINDIVLN